MWIQDSNAFDRELAAKYAPVLYLDEAEPFVPVQIGVTALRPGDRSPSFNREFRHPSGHQGITIIEYAIYWDYDIQHLYELEHVWVYIDGGGRVIDGESSFHGKYLRTLLPDRSNLEDETHIRLYAQPGKHAFMPKVDYFALVPNLVECCTVDAGKDGLTVNRMLSDRIRSSPEIDRRVEEHLRSLAFVPSMRFRRHPLASDMFVEWPELLGQIPERLAACLAEIGYTGPLYV
ncbi:hypothetical protein ACFFK0_24335 [Paenibacillus chartarius]|uniref:Uncharacterized protein n=1 Tax=Paenibacillus chartarius TaxID=747481 RepID=A0ABV6DSA2_9BACL